MGFWSWFLGIDEEPNNGRIDADTEIKEVTLQDAENFVAELKNYYYNDLCTLQINNDGSVLQKEMIAQEEEVLVELDNLIKEINEIEVEYQDIWKKSMYSFYEDLEKKKMKEAQRKVFNKLLVLTSINIKIDLDTIIKKRIQEFKSSWQIEGDINFLKNTKVILTGIENGIRTYRFGEFQKSVIETDYRPLTKDQQHKIDEMKFEFETPIYTDEVWVYIASVTRLELNFMRKTCFVSGKWEYTTANKDYICMDVVKTTDLSDYLKGALKIVLTKNQYAIISIIIPTQNMLGIIETKRNDNHISIEKEPLVLRERSGVYGQDLITLRLSRNKLIEKPKFISFLKFRETYF